MSEMTTSYSGTWDETSTGKEEDEADLAMMAEAEREFDENGGIPVEDVLKRVHTNQEAGEPMTPNPRAEGVGGWSSWQRDARGRFSRHRGGESGHPKYSRGYEAYHFEYLDSDYLNALESRLARAEALAGLATWLQKGLARDIVSRHMIPTTWEERFLAKYDRLTASESGEKTNGAKD